MDARIARLRIFAFYLVVIQHVTAGQAAQFGHGWQAATIINSLARVCIPLFLMISGATLLTKSEPLWRFLRKRLLRIVPPLIFWSCVYLWWLSKHGSHPGNWIIAILSGPTMFHLWFLYTILGLYALIPMMRRFYQHATHSEKLWALALWFIVGSLWPMISLLTTSHACGMLFPTASAAVYGLTAFGSYAGFLLLGAMLTESSPGLQGGAFIYAAGSVCTMGATYWISKRLNSPCDTFYNYVSPFVVIAGAGLFSAFWAAEKKAPSRLVATVADCTLGAYCLHVLIVGWIFPSIGIGVAGANTWFIGPSVALAGFVSSLAIIYVVRLTPPGRIIT